MAQTEDVVYLLHGFGTETGTDPEALVDCGEWINAVLGREPVSRVSRVSGAMLEKRGLVARLIWASCREARAIIAPGSDQMRGSRQQRFCRFDDLRSQTAPLLRLLHRSEKVGLVAWMTSHLNMHRPRLPHEVGDAGAVWRRMVRDLLDHRVSSGVLGLFVRHCPRRCLNVRGRVRHLARNLRPTGAVLEIRCSDPDSDAQDEGGSHDEANKEVILLSPDIGYRGVAGTVAQDRCLKKAALRACGCRDMKRMTAGPAVDHAHGCCFSRYLNVGWADVSEAIN